MSAGSPSFSISQHDAGRKLAGIQPHAKQSAAGSRTALACRERQDARFGGVLLSVQRRRPRQP
jgi:hypothetical protein